MYRLATKRSANKKAELSQIRNSHRFFLSRFSRLFLLIYALPYVASRVVFVVIYLFICLFCYTESIRFLLEVKYR